MTKYGVPQYHIGRTHIYCIVSYHIVSYNRIMISYIWFYGNHNHYNLYYIIKQKQRKRQSLERSWKKNTPRNRRKRFRRISFPLQRDPLRQKSTNTAQWNCRLTPHPCMSHCNAPEWSENISSILSQFPLWWHRQSLDAQRCFSPVRAGGERKGGAGRRRKYY